MAVAAGLSSPAAATCRVPADLMGFGAGLPALATTLARAAPLTVVALGSSSTYGVGATAPDRTYPAVLGQRLGQLWPTQAVTVINSGVNGDTARLMLDRLDHDVLRHQPTLVVWQTGTNDLLRGVPLAEFLADVADGVARLRASGADVVLMESQWLPTHTQNPVMAAYINGLRQFAKANGVPLFKRHALMQHLIDAESVPATDLIGEDGLHKRDAAYACTAVVLAERIVASVPQRMALHTADPAPPLSQ